MYLFLPTDGAPRVIDAAPTDSRISDDLGGTYVVACTGGASLLVHMRDDAAGLKFNPAATYLISMTGDKGTFPMYGNVVVTGVDATAQVNSLSGPVGVLGRSDHLEADRAHAGADIAVDGFYAHTGHDSAMEHPELASMIRYVLSRAERLEVPPGWPGVADRSARQEFAGIQGAVEDALSDATGLDGPFLI